MSVTDFIGIIIDPRTMFQVPRGRECETSIFSEHALRCARRHRESSLPSMHQRACDDAYGFKETKRGDEDYQFFDENTPLIKQ